MNHPLRPSAAPPGERALRTGAAGSAQAARAGRSRPNLIGQWPRLAAGALVVAAMATALSGCVALAGGAMIGGASLAVDRRTTGTQIDDQSIEFEASNAISQAIGDRGHVSATSYNRVVLLTGEVPDQADRDKVDKAVRALTKATGVVNELAIAPAASLSTQSNDALITAAVKAAFLNERDLQVASIKVITERNTVYLMGLVTETEGRRAAEVTRGVSGVRKVIKVFQTITPDELAALPIPPDSAKPAASAPAK